MAGKGGYQAPDHPAAVSGPGALSQRTDGKTQPKQNIPNAAYGEQASYQAAQDAGPLQGASILPFDRPTDRPGEPVTAGANAGPGMDAASAGIELNDATGDYQNLKYLLPGLQVVANLPSSTPSMRTFVRKLQSTVR